MRDALTLTMVADAFKISKDWFYRHRRRLEREHGFPLPMPGFKEPRWDPRALELWQDEQLRKAGLLPPMGADPAQPPLPGVDWADVLDRRAEAVAAAAE